MTLNTRDIVREALVPACIHRLRTTFTLLGIIVACGGLVATTSLVATGEEDLRKSLDGLYATSVGAQITPTGPEFLPGWQERLVDASDRSGAESASIRWSLSNTEATLSGPAQMSASIELDVTAAAGELPETTVTGTPLTLLNSLSETRSIWLGRATADRYNLGLGDKLTIKTLPWVVAGIIENSPTNPEWLLASVIPSNVAIVEFGLPQVAELEVQTRAGTAPQVAAKLPNEVSPAKPQNVVVLLPPDASGVAREIDDRVVGAGIGITIASILVGVVFIGVTSYASVLDRQPELALRRALGARRKDVAIVVFGESIATGLVGGVVGAVGGCGIGLLVALLRGADPVVPPWIAFSAIFCGLVMGAFGGLVPAIKAVRVDPIRFLRLL